MNRTKPELFPRIGGLLTGGPADAAVIRFAAALHRASRVERTTFLAMPIERAPEKPPTEAEVREALAEAAGARYADRSEVFTIGKEDAGAVLRIIRDEDLDLTIAGRRLPATQISKTALFQRLTRKSPSSVLLVHPYAEPLFERILVGSDFSPHSALAVRTALSLAGFAGPRPGRVFCQHVFAVPYGFRYAERSRSRFAAERARNLQRDIEAFLAEHRLPAGRITFLDSASEDDAAAISQMALAQRADLVAVGSRGHSKAAVILLGSTAEDLVSRCAATLLVVKQKGETVGVLRALLEV